MTILRIGLILLLFPRALRCSTDFPRFQSHILARTFTRGERLCTDTARHPWKSDHGASRPAFKSTRPGWAYYGGAIEE